MSGNLKKGLAVLIVVAIITAFCVLMIDYPISKNDAISLADKYLAAMEGCDYSAASQLYHKNHRPSAESLKNEASGNDPLMGLYRHAAPFGADIDNIDHRGYSKSNSGSIGRYSLTTAFTADGIDYVIIFTFKKNFFGYGITSCYCLPE